jgi:hypothetical protein
MDPKVRRAIVRVEVTRDNAVVRRGTGCLIGLRLVLTALHVIADRTTEPPEFFDGRIAVTFATHSSTIATVLEGKWNALEDWVLLSCAGVPENIGPLPMAMIESDGAGWTTHGFPDQNHEGLTIHGTVTNSHGELFRGRVAAYQLYSPEAAAAHGLRAKGLSGAPVIVSGAVVGVIRRALLEGEHTAAGTLFASPVSLVVTRCPELFPAPLQAISVVTQSSSIQAVASGLRRAAILLAYTILLAVVLSSVYRALAGESATPEVNMLFVVVAGLISFATPGIVRRRRSRQNSANQ